MQKKEEDETEQTFKPERTYVEQLYDVYKLNHTEILLLRKEGCMKTCIGLSGNVQ